MKKVVKILLWVVGIVLALFILLSLLAGPVAKGYVNRHGESLVGRQVHIDHVGLNLFNGHLNLRGLDVYEEDGTTSFAGFDTLDVRARLLKLVGKTVDIRSLVLAGLNVDVTQDGEHFNFSSMLDHFKSDEDKEEDKDTTPSDWVIRLGDIRISHAHASYHDLGRDKQWRIADMNLRVPGFVIGGEENTQAGLNLELEDGGRLNVTTDYDAASNDYVANLHLMGFALRNVKEYLEDNVALGDLRGSLDARLKASGNLSEIMQSHFSGTLELDDVALTDRQGDKVAALQSLAVGITDINIDAKRFVFSDITLEGLEARYEQWADGNTISRLIKKNDKPQAAEEPEKTDDAAASGQPSKPLSLMVGKLAVRNCSLTYDDHTAVDEFHFPVTNLGIEATNLTTSGNNNARMRATLPGGGTLAVRWQGNISNWKSFQDLMLNVSGLDMKQLSPLVTTYTGYPMQDGIFGLNTKLTISNSQLDNLNKIDIYKATVGERRKDVEPKQKIPLKAALYVLKDKDDKIAIEMPVKGNVSDPEFNYMKAVWKTLGNLLVKVATSPARAMATAMGISSEDLEFIAVAPDQKDLTSEQYHTLANLATVAKSDPLIVLTLELRMPEESHAERLNKHVRGYLLDQGLDESQVNVTMGAAPAAGEPTGYSITSELKMEE